MNCHNMIRSVLSKTDIKNEESFSFVLFEFCYISVMLYFYKGKIYLRKRVDTNKIIDT